MPETVMVRRTPSSVDEMRLLQNRIMHRAYELFEQNGSHFGNDLGNWIRAEREMIWKPPMEIRESDKEIVIEAAISGIDPKDIEIEATPEDMILKAETCHDHAHKEGTVHLCEFESGKMFRYMQFPKRINPDKVKAEVKNGLLRITAEIAEEARVRKIKPEAA